MLDGKLRKTMESVAAYYDGRKVGDVGHLGFRRSSPLDVLLEGMDHLIRAKVLVPRETRFLDLGCADGRVNVLFSYLVDASVGIEIDDWTLEEYGPLKDGLRTALEAERLAPPPDNIHLFLGDALQEDVHERVRRRTGLAFEDFDLFYTYITMHREYGELIADRARPGAYFLVYGLDLVLPRFEGLSLLEQECLVERKMILYRKE